MTRDALQILADANPEPTPTRYPDQTVRANIAAILDPTGQPFALLPHPGRNRPARRPLILLATACVLALAALTAVVVTRTNSTSPAGPISGTPGTITCAVTRASDTPARLNQARVAITARLATLGATRVDFALDPRTATIVLGPRGIDPAMAPAICRPAVTAIRPPISPAVNIDPSGAHSTDPLRGLPFPIPASETAYDRLTPGQRARLRTALAHTDCATVKVSPTGATAACSSGAPGAQQAWLLAPPLITGTDVSSATAQAPNVSASGGSAEWTVLLELTRAGATKLTAYTQQHHTDQTSASPLTCSTTTVPCSDFLAFTVGNRVQSAPITLAALGTRITLAGAFDEGTARALAAEYTAALVGLEPAR